MSLLAWTIYSAFIGAILAAVLGARSADAARKVALVTSLVGIGAGLAGVAAYKPSMGFATVVDQAWIPALGIRFHLAADGISLVLVLLTGLASLAGVLFSWNVERRTGEFFALYLALIGGVYGVFLSADLFLLFVFYEIAIVPKYFLIAIWGSTRREYGAMKLALYSFVGSALVLVGMLAAYVAAGGKSLGLLELSQASIPAAVQSWAFPMTFIGFAILAGLWPFHTWAPTGHVAAPTAASMLLAGVVMKLGAYGCLRVAMVLFPLGAKEWQMPMGWLAVTGIVFGALVALTQRDFKFVVGYSSVSHMGFVLLGLMSLHETGMSGAVLQMFSHGVIAGLLFGVVGRMVYDRAHTRELSLLQGLGLARAMPFAAVTFAIGSMASMGLPGFSGFVAEVHVLVGAWRANPTMAVLAGVGVLLGVVYTLRALSRVFLDPSRTRGDAGAVGAAGHGDHGAMEPITVPERAGAALLIAATVVVGLYPRVLLDWIVPAFEGALFAGLRKVCLL